MCVCACVLVCVCEYVCLCVIASVWLVYVLCLFAEERLGWQEVWNEGKDDCITYFNWYYYLLALNDKIKAVYNNLNLSFLCINFVPEKASQLRHHCIYALEVFLCLSR